MGSRRSPNPEVVSAVYGDGCTPTTITEIFSPTSSGVIVDGVTITSITPGSSTVEPNGITVIFGPNSLIVNGTPMSYPISPTKIGGVSFNILPTATPRGLVVGGVTITSITPGSSTVEPNGVTVIFGPNNLTVNGTTEPYPTGPTVINSVSFNVPLSSVYPIIDPGLITEVNNGTTQVYSPATFADLATITAPTTVTTAIIETDSTGHVFTTQAIVTVEPSGIYYVGISNGVPIEPTNQPQPQPQSLSSVYPTIDPGLITEVNNGITQVYSPATFADLATITAPITVTTAVIETDSAGHAFTTQAPVLVGPSGLYYVESLDGVPIGPNNMPMSPSWLSDLSPYTSSLTESGCTGAYTLTQVPYYAMITSPLITTTTYASGTRDGFMIYPLFGGWGWKFSCEDLDCTGLPCLSLLGYPLWSTGIITSTMTTVPPGFSVETITSASLTANIWTTINVGGKPSIAPVIVYGENPHYAYILFNLPPLPYVEFQLPGLPRFNIKIPCIKITILLITFNTCPDPPSSDDESNGENPDSSQNQQSPTSTSTSTCTNTTVSDYTTEILSIVDETGGLVTIASNVSYSETSGCSVTATTTSSVITLTGYAYALESDLSK